MSIWLLAVGLVVVTQVMAVGGLLLVRRLVPSEQLEPHHDVAAALISVVGVAYGVLLAFSVFLVWSNYATVQATAASEADSIAKMHRMVLAFPAQRPVVDGALDAYARYVLDVEWYGLGEGLPAAEGQRRFNDIFQALLTIAPQTDRDSDIYQEMLSAYGQMADDRRARIQSLRSLVPPVAWVALVGGSVATVVFTYFFGLRSLRFQVLMTGILTLTIALNLLLIIVLDRPFTVARIPPAAFEELQSSRPPP